MAYLTGLPIRGEPVVEEERSDYYDVVRDLLGPELVEGRQRPVRSIPVGLLSEMVGLRGLRRGPLETLDEFRGRVQVAYQPGERDDERCIRTFLMYFFGRMLFATQASHMNCKFLMLLRDFRRVGKFAWGAAMLGHLFSLLPSSSGKSRS